MLYMPTEEELQNKIERQKNFYRLQHTEKSIEYRRMVKRLVIMTNTQQH